MTPKQKALIRRSWASLREHPEALTDLFYQELFILNPGSRRLFRNKDIRIQGQAFIQMLALFMKSLDSKEPALTEAIEESGRRHVGYGVTYSDYEPAGRALLWALEQSLGPGFTPDVRGAWAEAYGVLAGTMRQVSSGTL